MRNRVRPKTTLSHSGQMWILKITLRLTDNRHQWRKAIHGAVITMIVDD